ncbi:MAG: TolC family protein [Gammaproteobacteria bacterium]
MSSSRSLGITALSCVLCACQLQDYREKPIETSQWVQSFEQRDLSARGLRDFLAQCGLPSNPWPRSRWEAAGLECAALYYHPDLAKARAAIDVAHAQEHTAGQKPNPSAALRLEHQGGDPKAGEPWGIGPQFDIPIEGSGKRAARIERAVAETTVAEIDLEARIWEVRRSVRDRLLEWQEARQRLTHAREKLALLDQGESLLRRRQELGLASTFEVSSMRIDAQRSRLAVSAAQAKANTAIVQLAASMTVPVTALRSVEIDMMPSAATIPGLPGASTLQQQALTRRTDIRRALQEYVVAEKTLKEEIARQYPDFNFSPGYFFDPTDSINIWSFGVSMVLPMFNRNEGPIAEAEARRELAARNVESVQANIVGEVQGAAAGYVELQNALSEADAVITELNDQEQRLQKQFALGEADRLALVRAQLETAEARTSRMDLMIEQQRALNRLEDAVQLPLRPELNVNGQKQ